MQEQNPGKELDIIVRLVRNYAGLLRKNSIQDVYKILSSTHKFGSQMENFGDDAAPIPWGSGYLLLATDGMMTSLLIEEPYATGKASILVTVNDIYSMGGRPLGLVNVLASGDEQQRTQIAQGIKNGCQRFKVPMLGGHLHPDSPKNQPALSVAILGWAKKLIRSHLAKTGDALILAVDLNGQTGCNSMAGWNTNSDKSPDELLNRLEVLPKIAEEELANAGKDVSNAGLLGTLCIMLENSGKGALINLQAIPKPALLSLRDWVLCFQSYGFILSAPQNNSKKIMELFAEQKITTAVIGQVTSDSKVILSHKEKQKVLFDFSMDKITGISVKDFKQVE